MEEVESEWDAWGMIGKASLKELMKQREELSEGGRGCDHEADSAWRMAGLTMMLMGQEPPSIFLSH